jgi:AcrR family transcriptional regulator
MDMTAVAGSELRAARRLSRGERREQLVAAAMPVVARQGLGGFSLDAIAARAGVTRNLLYHYFPRGRADIVLAVAERAGGQLTGGWVTDEFEPLNDRLSANFARIMDHALAPTHAWRIHRMARAALDPELDQVVERFVDVVISSIALNHLGTPDPPPLVRLALGGFVAFTETVLERARSEVLPRAQVATLLAQTLTATIDAALSDS